jgi:hypothetical protein
MGGGSISSIAPISTIVRVSTAASESLGFYANSRSEPPSNFLFYIDFLVNIAILGGSVSVW